MCPELHGPEHNSKSMIGIVFDRGQVQELKLLSHLSFSIISLFNQVFQRKTLVIKMVNVGQLEGGRLVGRASTVCFQSITPQPLEMF